MVLEKHIFGIFLTIIFVVFYEIMIRERKKVILIYGKTYI